MPDSDAQARQLGRIAWWLRFAVLATLTGIATWLLYDVMLVVFAAALFGILLHGLARPLTRLLRLPHWAAVAVVALALLAAAAGLGWEAGPRLADQAEQLQQKLMQLSGDWRDILGRHEWGRQVLAHLPSLRSLGEGAAGHGLAGSVAGFFGSVFGALGTLAVILISGLYFAFSPRTYTRGLVFLLPADNREEGGRILDAMGDSLWHWIAGQALDMVCVGVASGLGLWLLGVPLALVLGVVAGVSNFVPYIGAIVGFLPALLIAVSVNPGTGLYVLGLYAVIQGLEGNVLAPLIQRRASNLSPALTILSQTAAGALFGVPGLMLATPLAAAAVAVARQVQPPLEE